jgi:uncharacterized protein (TIGR02271 family)
MTNYDEPITISHGMDVLGSDGEKVGDVADMRGDYVVVSKGFFFPTDYFIPTSAINTVSDGKVYLAVTKDQALSQGWDQEPAFTESVTTDEPITDLGLPIQNPVPQTTDAGYAADATAYETSTDDMLVTDDAVIRNDADTISVPVVEEELTATTREVERGGVQVEKVVTAQDQTLEVPVTEEHLNVTRRRVDRDAPVGEQAFEEITIEVPLHAEEVDVQKRARVVEEVDVTREATTETQQVTGTVRREDVRITDATGNVVDDETTRR